MTFEGIYRLYGKRILNLAYRMTAQEEVARDLTQDIFIKVYQNLDTFGERSDVFTWMYRIAVNHILNYLKREKRYRWLNVLDKSLSDMLMEDKIDPTFWGSSNAPSSDGVLEKSEREKIIWSKVQSLSTKYRAPLVLYYYEEKSYQEIADVMELSLSAVESRIHRARKQLIAKLEPWLKTI